MLRDTLEFNIPERGKENKNKKKKKERKEERERQKEKGLTGRARKTICYFFLYSFRKTRSLCYPAGCETVPEVLPFPQVRAGRCEAPQPLAAVGGGCSDAARSEVAPWGGRCGKRGAERGGSAELRGAGAAPTSGRSRRNQNSQLCFIARYCYYLF